MKNLKYDYVVGTGGIGTGILFQFSDNATLGRNESRLARLMETKDFCKLHIILHYIATYLEHEIAIYAIGRVGIDHHGREVLGLMEEYGIDCRYIKMDPDAATMYSVCYAYPNSDGGNITTSNSASKNVTTEDIDLFFEREKPVGRGVVLAAPEVSLEVRFHLLQKGREWGCFNAASFTSGEMGECVQKRIFTDVDLLSINQEEMEALMCSQEEYTEKTPEECYQFLRTMNRNIYLIVTQGGDGAQFFSNGSRDRIPAIWKPVNNTAGAGDCFLATVISGLISGVPFVDTDMKVGLGGMSALASSIKVACQDTIDFTLDKDRLRQEAERLGIEFSEKIVRSFFKNPE